jgi:glycosyltransferase involved in cell wall biosynthesis
MSERPIVLHLIDSYGVGGAQQRYFNDLEHLGPPFEHWPCAVFAENGGAPQGARLTLPMRSLGLERLRSLPVAWASLMTLLRKNPAIRLIHTQLFAADTIGRVAGRLSGLPVVSTIQASIYEPDSGLYSRRRHTVDSLTARWATTQLVAVSDFVRRSVNVRLGVPLDRIVVIPNTVDTEVVRPNAARRMAARSELALGDSTFVWLNVGRLHPAKGLAFPWTPSRSLSHPARRRCCSSPAAARSCPSCNVKQPPWVSRIECDSWGNGPMSSRCSTPPMASCFPV